MNLNFCNFYLSHPKQFVKDILFKKSNTHNLHNYLSLITAILDYKFYNTYPNDKIPRANAINKIIRILALNVQETIITHVLNNEPQYRFNPIFINGQLGCPKCHVARDLELFVPSPKQPFPFDISKNPTISSPWDINKLICTFGNIVV